MTTKPKQATAGETQSIDPGAPNYDLWTKHQVGFAPYWNPKEGELFEGIILEVDQRDPTFIRYLCQATRPLECATGPSDEAERVRIEAGEHFTLSTYYSLNNLFVQFLVSGLRPIIMCRALKKRKTKKSGYSVWTWEVRSAPQFKEALTKFFASEQSQKLLAAATKQSERQNAEELEPEPANAPS